MKKPLSIAHLSDLHLTATDGGRRKEDGARRMNANLGRILTHPAVDEADLVLITGDVSDRGELAAWNVLWSSIRQAGLDRGKILVIHGNHDAACLGLRRTRPTAEDLAIVRAGLEKGRQRTGLEPALTRWRSPAATSANRLTGTPLRLVARTAVPPRSRIGPVVRLFAMVTEVAIYRPSMDEHVSCAEATVFPITPRPGTQKTARLIVHNGGQQESMRRTQ